MKCESFAIQALPAAGPCCHGSRTLTTRPRLLNEALRLLAPFWGISLLATSAGALGGLATAWLLATVNAGLHAPGGPGLPMLLRFAALCLLSVAGTAIAGVGNSIVGQKVIAALRKDISARILRAPIAQIEAQRSHRLLAVLTGDVDMVSAFTFNMSGYAIAFAVVLGSFIYLLRLSPPVFGAVLAAVALGIGLNISARRGWIRDYEGVRGAQDELQKQYRAITDGAKELRLSRPRRNQVHGGALSAAADRIATLKSRAMRLFWLADALGSAIFFGVVGLLLAARHAWALDPAVITGAVLVLLYVKGPMEQIANGLPVLGQAQVAFRRIAALSAAFDAPAARAGGNAPPAFASAIALRGATYRFPGAQGFALGPVDLTIHRGETVFIVGANGSGKTTLIKLLLGLYAPTDGALLLDGTPVPPQGLDDYRQLFSAVFSDNFLFDVLPPGHAADAAQLQAWLQRLEISHKLAVQDGAFSTLDLSTGQRKRVALVQAWLEQRPILMFDEWAADQDPSFRRVFYDDILPGLKRAGKTLIVVSHDDRFFAAADRIIHLDAGHIMERPMRHPLSAIPIAGVPQP